MPRLRRTLSAPLLVAAAGLLACGAGDSSSDTETAAPTTDERAATPTTATTTETETRARTAQSAPRVLATGLRVPWGVAFLPGGDALVSERETGRIWRITPGGRERRVARVPGVDLGADNEGGLMGLAVSPSYRRDGLVYAMFTSSRDNRVVRFRLGGRPRVVISGLPRGAYRHNGGRIAFGPDGKLYIGAGDAGEASIAQDRSSLGGKILRVNPNGSVPAGNPFPGSPVYSLGHRNVQGLAWDGSRRLWSAEFGEQRFDELNQVRAGRNYGWPSVEGRGSTSGGRFTNPARTWRTPDASPSGIAIRGSNLYMGALVGARVWRVPLRGRAAGTPRALYAGRFGRIRTVARAPDGALWLTTSNRDGRGSPSGSDDRVIRIG